jgi:hypothetical protein
MPAWQVMCGRIHVSLRLQATVRTASCKLASASRCADAHSLQVDWADAHGNTVLSEAAAGGAASVCRHLLASGAEPNSQGEFKRTPLWQAAFQPMLKGGADPRVGNESGELPLHVDTPQARVWLIQRATCTRLADRAHQITRSSNVARVHPVCVHAAHVCTARSSLPHGQHPIARPQMH